MATSKTKKRPAKKAVPKKAVPKKAVSKKAVSKKAPAKKAASKKAVGTTKKAPSKKAPSMAARRADYGKPVEGFFAKQPATMLPILEALRRLIERAAPDAVSSLKWGMPFYEIEGNLVCALGGHKAHVNLILPGAPGTYSDPQGLLEGDGKTGRRLKLQSLAELPEKVVRGWLGTAVARARRGEAE